MGTSSQYYVVELPLRIGDEESRRLAMAFEFGRTIYNATLGQALGKLTHMRRAPNGRTLSSSRRCRIGTLNSNEFRKNTDSMSSVLVIWPLTTAKRLAKPI